MDKLLRIQEVAALTGVPIGTLRHWRLEGRGPRSSKLGRRVVYRETDVQKWVSEQLAATASDAV